MYRGSRLLVVAVVLLTIPALAQDKKDDKTDKDAKSSAATPAKKYDVVQTVSAKLVKVDSKEMNVTLDMPKGRYPEHQKFWLTDDVKVRSKNPPEQFDDNGKPKKYTAQELQKLKGPDPRLPGFPAELSQLNGGETVQVTIAKEKQTQKPKSKDKDAKPAEEKLYITMLLITNDNRAINNPEKKKN